MTYETYGNRGTPPADHNNTGEAAASGVHTPNGVAKRPSNAITEIRRFLERHELRSYCDACLARRFDVPVDEARTITRMLSTGTGFVRQNRTCAACTQMAVTTSVGITLWPA